MREPQSSVAQEVEREITMVSHTSTAATQRGAERGEIRSAEIGKFAALEVAPDGLDRIQVRRIGWQPLDAQPLARTGQIAQHYATLVRRQSIPDEDHWLTAEVTLQLPEKRDEGAVGVRAGLRVKEEACASAIPPEGQRRRHRQPLPGAADMSQDGRVAPVGRRARYDRKTSRRLRGFSIWISTSGGSLGSKGAVSKLPERTVAFVRLVTTTLWMSHVPVAPFTSNSPEPATLVKIPPTVFSELASVPLLTMTRYGVSGAA